jgi:hypothetical protein
MQSPLAAGSNVRFAAANPAQRAWLKAAPGISVEAQLTVGGSLSIRPARWNRKAFALELAQARSAMPMSEPVMEELHGGARY